MKIQHILINSLLMAVCFSQVVMAQGVITDQADSTQNSRKTSVASRTSVPTREVKGCIVGIGTKEPIPGILVQSLGNRRYSAMTDVNGMFRIKVPLYETTLIIQSPGYLSQKVAIDTVAPRLEIGMVSDVFRPMFDNTTGILAMAEAKPVNTSQLTVEDEIAQNMGADIRVVNRSGGPGFGATMFIRGLNSLHADAQPLIVIDGIIQDMQRGRDALHYGEYTNLLFNLNPEDIAKIQVMKNGTAIYGAKGSNGVVLIETKRGYSLATRIDANVGVGVSLIPYLPKMMDASQFRNYATEMLGTYPKINDYTREFRFLSDDESKFYYKTYHNEYDWKDEVYHTAMTQNYNINVQGGDDVGMYNLSMGYSNAQSTARDNGVNRLNVRFNNDIYILRKLVSRIDMSFTKINRDVFDNGAPEDFTTGPVSSPTLLGLIKSPFLVPYAYSGITGLQSETLNGPDDYLENLNNPNLTLGNPRALLENGHDVNKNRSEITHFNATISPKYQLSQWTNLINSFSYTYDYNSQRYYRPIGGMPSYTIPDVGPVQRMSSSLSGKETSLEDELRLEWSRLYGPHNISAFGGARFVSFSSLINSPKGQWRPGNGNDKNPNLSNTDYQEAMGLNDNWRGFTWFGNAEYGYRNKYFGQVSLALESNSRFGENAGGIGMFGVQWGVFPSVQAGWALTSESWFPRNLGINYLLLHTGFDISGNDNISNYAARTSFNVVKFLYQSNGIQLNNIGNDKIQWEQTTKFDIGLKSSFLNNRIGFNVDYYFHHTSNLLTLKNIDNPLIGINQYWSNGGSLENSGFELSLTTKPVITRNLNVEVGASIGHYKNELKSLPSYNDIYLDGKLSARGLLSSAYGTDNIATIVGQPVGVFYGYKTDGVLKDEATAATAGKDGYLYQLDETGQPQYFHAGDMKFVDIDGDGQIGERDRTVIGNPNPDIYGNIFATVNWKHLTLSAVFNYSLGNDVFNYYQSVLEGGKNFYNQTVAMTNRWRSEGQETSIPRALYGDPMGNSRFSDRWIEDGSYLRLKTLNLTYKIPSGLTWLQGLSIWAEATNLFTITKYTGSDPEFSVSDNVLYQGIDAGNVAQGRVFTLGMRINL